jgi:hypothetical protein
MLSLLLLVGLVLLPFYLDNWFHNREQFELRKAVYASNWQRWMMNNRNLARYGSMVFLWLAMVGLSGQYVQFSAAATALLWALGAVSFLTFMAFQVLPHTF